MRTLALLALVAALGCSSGSPRPTVVVAPTDVEEPAADVRERVANPRFANWSRFSKGTAVVRASVTGADGDPNTTTTTTTLTLIERTDENLTLELKTHTKRYDGAVTDHPPDRIAVAREMPLPRGAKKEDFGKPAAGTTEGEETVAVGGASYRAKWTRTKDRNEAGEVFAQVWMCDEVPDGLVKSVTRTPAIGKTTTTELVEVRKP